MPPEFTGGLGEEGVKALRDFVETGGTLIFLNRASNFAIEQFKLPLRNVVAGLPRTDFYVPGSILRIELDTSHPLASGMPKETIAWAEDSPVFEVTNDPDASVPAANVHVIASYPADKDPLLSGWLLGGDLIKGKAALVEVTMGKGRVILFGFRPQYRAQSLATLPVVLQRPVSKCSPGPQALACMSYGSRPIHALQAKRLRVPRAFEHVQLETFQSQDKRINQLRGKDQITCTGRRPPQCSPFSLLQFSSRFDRYRHLLLAETSEVIGNSRAAAASGNQLVRELKIRNN